MQAEARGLGRSAGVQLIHADVRSCAAVLAAALGAAAPGAGGEGAVFDLVVDKSTIDALLCHPDGLQHVAQECAQIASMLSPGGAFCIISHNAMHCAGAELPAGRAAPLAEWLLAVGRGAWVRVALDYL